MLCMASMQVKALSQQLTTLQLLKQQGSSAMQLRQYDKAVELYTKALAGEITMQ